MADEPQVPEEGPNSEFVAAMLKAQAEGDQLSATIRENAEEAEQIVSAALQAMLLLSQFLRQYGAEPSDIAGLLGNLTYRVLEMQKASEILGGGGGS